MHLFESENIGESFQRYIVKLFSHAASVRIKITIVSEDR